MTFDDDELVPGKPGYDKAIAQGEFEFAKTRYVRTLTFEGVVHLIEKSAAARAKLKDEINNLRQVAKDRHETAVAHARTYGAVLPHRVGKTWIQPPGPTEKIGEFFGAGRLYKAAAKAAKDYTEVRDLLIKRREQLLKLEDDLRHMLEMREAALLRQIDSGDGLRTALLRDPLLKVAYDKMRALDDDLNGPRSTDGLTDM